MEFVWPEYETPQPLGDGRTWTARHDSYDQYRDDCYYLVWIWDGDTLVTELMTKIGMEFAGDVWTVPTFEPELRRRIVEIAMTGNANTDWTGYFSRRPREP